VISGPRSARRFIDRGFRLYGSSEPPEWLLLVDFLSSIITSGGFGSCRHGRRDLHMIAPTRLDSIVFMISRDLLSSSVTPGTKRYGKDTLRLCRIVSPSRELTVQLSGLRPVYSSSPSCSLPTAVSAPNRPFTSPLGPAVKNRAL
jgi:hypothetical protein